MLILLVPIVVEVAANELSEEAIRLSVALIRSPPAGYIGGREGSGVDCGGTTEKRSRTCSRGRCAIDR